MKKTLTTLALASSVALGALAAAADDFSPAIIYDIGGKNDKSFNEGVWNGVKRFIDETGAEVAEFEVTSAEQREQAMQRMIDRGANLVIGVGFNQGEAIDKLSREYPDVDFAIIDVNFLEPRDNLRQIAFKEQEGSYLVGVAAATKSETGTVGYIAALDFEVLHAFGCGYAQGVIATGGEVINGYIGEDFGAFNDPNKATEVAQSQLDKGADVIFAAAGGAGLGVLQAAADAGKYSIGVDTNQNFIQPGSVLTTMEKRVDIAAYNALKDKYEDNFDGGVVTLGIAEGGVDYSVDEFNAEIFGDDIRAAVEDAKAKILSGEIEVHDFRSDKTCPVAYFK